MGAVFSIPEIRITQSVYQSISHFFFVVGNKITLYNFIIII